MVHLAVFMICEDEVPSAVHDLPEPERATFEQTIANIIAQKALPWRRFLAATCPHRPEVINAFDKEIAAIIDFGVMDEVLSSDPEYEEAVRLATLCRPLLDRKADATWKGRLVKRGDLEDSDAEEPARQRSLVTQRALCKERDVCYLQSSEAVHELVDVERYAKLHASSVQHPASSQSRW